MNILIITSGILPDTHSGIAKITYYIGRELKRKGNQIVILTRRYKKDHAKNEIIDGMFYYRVPISERWGPLNKMLWPLATPIQSRRWQKKLKTLYPNIDLVWILNPWWTVLMYAKKRLRKAQIVYQFYVNPNDEIISNHGKTLISSVFGYIYNYITKREMERSDYISNLSKYARKDALLMMGSKAGNKMIIVPGGVDMDRFTPFTREEKSKFQKSFSIPEDCTIFITARGLKGRTGVDKLVLATARLKKEAIPFFLIIIGKGPMKQQIERSIKVLNLENNTKLLSDLSETTLAHYYSASDVFILPTQAAEAFGLATTEAISAGLVALGTNNGGTPEILSKYKSNWIIQGKDEISIYKKMKEYCENPEKFLLPIDKMQKVTRSHYSWPQVVKIFLESCQL